MRLEELHKDAVVIGIMPGVPVRIVSVEAMGDDAVSVVFRGPDGRLQDQMLFRHHEADLKVAETGRPCSLVVLRPRWMRSKSASMTSWPTCPGARTPARSALYWSDRSLGKTTWIQHTRMRSR